MEQLLQRRKQYLEAVTHGRLEKTPQDMIARYRLVIDNLTNRMLRCSR